VPGPATEVLRRIADFIASRDDPVQPYEQIARFAKEQARAFLANIPEDGPIRESSPEKQR
jgi:hypothetical protein